MSLECEATVYIQTQSPTSLNSSSHIRTNICLMTRTLLRLRLWDKKAGTDLDSVERQHKYGTASRVVINVLLPEYPVFHHYFPQIR